MTTNLKRKVALKGQSRSKFCGEPTGRSKTSAACQRLAGHSGKHRPFMTRAAAKAAKIAASTPVVAVAEVTAEGGAGAIIAETPAEVAAIVEQPAKPAAGKVARRTARRPKVRTVPAAKTRRVGVGRIGK